MRWATDYTQKTITRRAGKWEQKGTVRGDEAYLVRSGLRGYRLRQLEYIATEHVPLLIQFDR
jgi:hypothetical protein